MLGGSWDALSDDRCDLVIGAEGAPPAPGFALHSLGKVKFGFAVAAGHALTERPQPLPASAIQDYPTVIVADSSQRLPVRSAGLLDGRSRIIVPTIEHKIEVHCKGLGVGYLPLHRIMQQLADGRLEILALDAPRPPVEISVAWRRGNTGKALKWFVDHLKQMQFDADRGVLTPNP